MNRRVQGRSLAGSFMGVAAVVALGWSASFAMAQAPTQPTQQLAEASGATSGLAARIAMQQSVDRVWQSAKSGRNDELLTNLHGVVSGAPGTPGSVLLTGNLESLERNLAKREATRQTKLAEALDKLNKEWEKAQAAGLEDRAHWKALSESVKRAVEMHSLSIDKDAFKKEARTQQIVAAADRSAREAEAKGDWFTANELFFRLGALMDEEGTYRPDMRRLGLRLSMIRMYAPELFWKLRNDERLETGKTALPPYNGLGEDFRDKIKDIDRTMVLRAIFSANDRWIKGAKMSELVRGGLESLRTMLTTSDLRQAFPKIGEAGSRDAMIAVLERKLAKLEPNAVITRGEVADIMEDLIKAGKASLDLPEGAVLHEFGNGAMSRLDDFSAMIWPDEVSRFDRMTQGSFIGVGVQIQIDEESQMIKVVTPIEGTPAQRAGIRTGDLIKKIDGQSAVGINLNQAVEKITGLPDSRVTITMERPKAGKDEAGNDISKDIDFNLIRQKIPLGSVKGWERTGVHEEDWNWLVDKSNGIGYVRMSQFTEDTTKDLHKAIDAMRSQASAGGGAGLQGVILDLRFNPGGLLTEAVSVASTFIDRGTIVSTKGTMPAESKSAQPGNTKLNGVPTIVLINEGSASASEIVAGAVRHYADSGQIASLVVGQRSFGKGSVQNVWPLAPNAKMKLTTQYYYLPDGRVIHKEPGATNWGVDPHLKIEDLIESQSDAIKLRQDADVLPIDEKGKVVASTTLRPSPQKLFDDGLDLQLQYSLAILQARAVGKVGEQARLPE